MTLQAKYYKINELINNFSIAQNLNCPVVKYGVDPATIRDQYAPTMKGKYPYIQTHYRAIKEQAWTSSESGTFTNFEYMMNFFTSPKDERTNDLQLWYPFEVIKNALADINLLLLNGVANVLDKTAEFDFSMKSGQAVPTGSVIYRMQAMCSYALELEPATEATDYWSGFTFEEE